MDSPDASGGAPRPPPRSRAHTRGGHARVAAVRRARAL